MEIEDKEGTQKDDKIKREKGRLGRQKQKKEGKEDKQKKEEGKEDTGKNDKTKNELLILSCFNFYLILDLFPLQDAPPTAFQTVIVKVI